MVEIIVSDVCSGVEQHYGEQCQDEQWEVECANCCVAERGADEDWGGAGDEELWS